MSPVSCPYQCVGPYIGHIEEDSLIGGLGRLEQDLGICKAAHCDYPNK